MQPWGSVWFFQTGTGLATFIFMPLAFLAPVGFLAAGLWRRRWVDVALAVLLTLTNWVSLNAISEVVWTFRRPAVERCVEGARPLVDAIRKYESEQGTRPATLEELIPRYLADIPNTGLGAFPVFEYTTEDTHGDGEPWSLRVPTSLGMVNWDMLLYLPSQRYPQYGYGGRLERVGDWAYVHE
jgi:hypothetical protein